MKKSPEKVLFGTVVAGFTAAMFFTSCSGSSWSQEERDTFLNECDTEGGSDSYCQCYMEKVMEKYPKHEDSKKMDFESAVEMAKSCE